jgi:glutathione S-transferase
MRWVSEHVAYIEPRGDAVLLPFLRGKPDLAALCEPAAVFRGELDRMQAVLATSPWLAGSAVSAADLTVFPEIMHLLRASARNPEAFSALGLHPLGERYPAVAVWVERVQGMPGFDRTYPPHWRAP